MECLLRFSSLVSGEGRERVWGKQGIESDFLGQVLLISKAQELKIASYPLVFIASLSGGF